MLLLFPVFFFRRGFHFLDEQPHHEITTSAITSGKDEMASSETDEGTGVYVIDTKHRRHHFAGRTHVWVWWTSEWYPAEITKYPSTKNRPFSVRFLNEPNMSDEITSSMMMFRTPPELQPQHCQPTASPSCSLSNSSSVTSDTLDHTSGEATPTTPSPSSPSSTQTSSTITSSTSVSNAPLSLTLDTSGSQSRNISSTSSVSRYHLHIFLQRLHMNRFLYAICDNMRFKQRHTAVINGFCSFHAICILINECVPVE